MDSEAFCGEEARRAAAFTSSEPFPSTFQIMRERNPRSAAPCPRIRVGTYHATRRARENPPSLSLSLSCPLSLAHPRPTLVVAFRFCPSSRPSSTSPPASSVCRCCSARPAIYASVESVRCCGQLPRFKENQELRPERDSTSACSPGPSPVPSGPSLVPPVAYLALQLYHPRELPFPGSM